MFLWKLWIRYGISYMVYSLTCVVYIRLPSEIYRCEAFRFLREMRPQPPDLG